MGGVNISSLTDLDICDRARTGWKSRRREARGGDGCGVSREQETLDGEGAVSCLAAWGLDANLGAVLLVVSPPVLCCPVTLELVFNLYMQMTCASYQVVRSVRESLCVPAL